MTRWLTDDELQAWVRLVAVVELLPGSLEQQLRRDSGLSHFEYFVMAMLSEAPGRRLRMTALAARANATLSRLSHVVSRLEARGPRGAGAVPAGRAGDQRVAHARRVGRGGSRGARTRRAGARWCSTRSSPSR